MTYEADEYLEKAFDVNKLVKIGSANKWDGRAFQMQLPAKHGLLTIR